jgi:predicted deacylase
MQAETSSHDHHEHRLFASRTEAAGILAGSILAHAVPNAVGRNVDDSHYGVSARGTGPTVSVLGGNRGDEYQGQIAAMRLARELSPDAIHGRLISIPSLNFPAAAGSDTIVAPRRDEYESGVSWAC